MTECLIIDQRKKMEILNFIPSGDSLEKLSTLFQNFSDATRLKILSCLAISEMCVSDLSQILKINQTTVSHQLKILRDNNIVKFKRNGKILLYSVSTKQVNDVLSEGVDLIEA
ncbi:MAG: metalloregulator ArsR/SmtB family transcription factor [Clostridia bacterium]